jgi:ribosome-binding factor A
MPLGGGQVDKVVAALSRARPFLRRRVAGVVKLKFVPDLHFIADPSFDEAGHIETLLRDPRVARDLGDEGEDSAKGNEGNGS